MKVQEIGAFGLGFGRGEGGVGDTAAAKTALDDRDGFSLKDFLDRIADIVLGDGLAALVVVEGTCEDHLALTI